MRRLKETKSYVSAPEFDEQAGTFAMRSLTHPFLDYLLKPTALPKTFELVTLEPKKTNVQPTATLRRRSARVA